MKNNHKWHSSKYSFEAIRLYMRFTPYETFSFYDEIEINRDEKFSNYRIRNTRSRSLWVMFMFK